YNAFRQNTWVVPLVAETGKYQTVALVQAKNGHVVVGSSSSPSPQDDAFAQYAAFLGGGAALAAVAAGGERGVTGNIDRIAAAPTGLLYFTLRGARRVYTVDSHDVPLALLARSGDRISFRSLAAGSGFAMASNFADTSLAP
ncbi:MAG: hypothetical protein IAI50_05515, partial [Candidatus Eremiobacteraeota bacterium]|nr:hypothetical protein [Candidatus Eremiobacteraeota bacterium]